MLINCQVLITLILISLLGVITFPFGNPRFIGEAIFIELSFITLSILIWRGYTIALYACIALALTVVIGNTASPAHVHLMTTVMTTSTSSIVLSFLTHLYNFLGSGIYSLTSGSNMRISLQTLLWSRSKRNPDNVKVMYSL